ncbi:hypothetical protein C4J65_10500 [Streptomyces sp. CB09001]|uniref:AAA family ATPase n=1 Tax=Streptomyces sp. CB09001 TaxID=2083284 RepID=UPI000E213EFD|nr:AAA family ATPase [Streptomyces sp. CB09001]AXL88709.1 hypothetical protein C4J65_10500 [Streptomyces sp. CB09001]
MHDSTARDDGTGNDDQLGDGYDRNGQLHVLPIVGRDGEPSFTLVSREEIEAAHEEALEEEAEREEDRANDEWYHGAVKDFEAKRAYWREQYEADPPSAVEKALAQNLLTAGYLEETQLGRPISPRDTGAREYEPFQALPPGWLIREANARYNEDRQKELQETTADIRVDVGRFEDSARALFYRAKLNYLFGKGGSGKTTLLLHVVAEYVMNSQPVVWLTFEDMTGDELRDMLVRQGVHQILADYYFHPVKVTKGWVPFDNEEEPPSLVILDSVNPCMKLLGLNPNDADAMSDVVTTYFDPYRDADPEMTGIAIDHVGLSEKAQDRPSGHHSKLDKFQGAAYRLAPIRDGVDGDWGYSALYLAKDNKGKTGFRKGKPVGYLVMDSSAGDDTLDVRITAEEPTGTSHTPPSERAAAIEGNSTRAIAERLIAAAGADGLSRKEWGAAILAELKTAKPDVDDARHNADIRDNISKLRRAEVVGQNSDGNLIHLPTVKPLD